MWACGCYLEGTGGSTKDVAHICCVRQVEFRPCSLFLFFTALVATSSPHFAIGCLLYPATKGLWSGRGIPHDNCARTTREPQLQEGVETV